MVGVVLSHVHGYGVTFPDFWITGPCDSTTPTTAAVDDSGLHLAFDASTRAQVRAFYEAAMKAGATDNGKPGVRSEYHRFYYGAFVKDAEGRNLEAVCHMPGVLAGEGLVGGLLQGLKGWGGLAVLGAALGGAGWLYFV